MIDIIPSSGNVFADLGLPDAEEMLVKSSLAMHVNAIIEDTGFTQAQVAAILGIPQPKVSLLNNGKLRGFSVAKLCHFLTLLGNDVDIVVKPREGQGTISVVLA